MRGGRRTHYGLAARIKMLHPVSAIRGKQIFPRTAVARQDPYTLEWPGGGEETQHLPATQILWGHHPSFASELSVPLLSSHPNRILPGGS